jgi:malate synthase
MNSLIRTVGTLSNSEKEKIFSKEALNFAAHLHQKFNTKRVKLLEKRKEQQEKINNGEFPTFLSDTNKIRTEDWQVALAPNDLQDRRIEITGPTEAKMMINALNSEAKVFMADIEDSLSPSWENITNAQVNLYKAVRKTLEFTADKNGKHYKLNSKTATLVVRPRGWHLEEKNILVDGKPISGSILDFAIFFYNNADELLKRQSGPYFYLPKLENAVEARLWNEIFVEAQNYCNIPQGTIRATVLLETILAAFEMDEILFELKDHVSGMNAGRWDYIFSMIKRFAKHSDFILPDRNKITMTVPFMRSYTKLLVQTCHKRKAHAIGGMSAFIPSRKDQEINKTAISQVTKDKQREADDGFDGTWVAHPDLVPVALNIFTKVLGENPHQKNKLDLSYHITDKELIAPQIKDEFITEEGLRNNITVSLKYLSAWLNGLGAVAINNLMEDAATAEIARAQIWQWIHHDANLKDGRSVNKNLYEQIKQEELTKIEPMNECLKNAESILDNLVLSKNFEEFLTVPSSRYL